MNDQIGQKFKRKIILNFTKTWKTKNIFNFKKNLQSVLKF